MLSKDPHSTGYSGAPLEECKSVVRHHHIEAYQNPRPTISAPLYPLSGHTWGSHRICPRSQSYQESWVCVAPSPASLPAERAPVPPTVGPHIWLMNWHTRYSGISFPGHRWAMTVLRVEALKFLTSTNNPNPPQQDNHMTMEVISVFCMVGLQMPLENLAILWTCEIKQRKEHLPCEPSFTSAPVPSTQNVVPRHSGTDMGGVIPVFCPQSTAYFSTDFLIHCNEFLLYF